VREQRKRKGSDFYLSDFRTFTLARAYRHFGQPRSKAGELDAPAPVIEDSLERRTWLQGQGSVAGPQNRPFLNAERLNKTRKALETRV
jgi:hypothetical protein